MMRRGLDKASRRHGGCAPAVAQRFADAHFVLGEHETGEFWAALATLLRQKLGELL